jgi:hypothetical protein
LGNPKVKWHDLPYLGFGRKKKRKEKKEVKATVLGLCHVGVENGMISPS